LQTFAGVIRAILLNGAFIAILYITTLPRGCDNGAASSRDFMERCLRQGFVQGALLPCGQTDFSAAC